MLTRKLSQKVEIEDDFNLMTIFEATNLDPKRVSQILPQMMNQIIPARETQALPLKWQTTKKNGGKNTIINVSFFDLQLAFL